MSLLTIPAELRERRQWVCWKLEPRDGRPTKVPVRADDPTLRASSTDPTTWRTFEEARACAGVAGIGFVFTPDDPFCGVDLDGCLDRETGELHPAAAEIIASLDAYAEVSPSGAGMHVFVDAVLHGHRNKTSETPWGGEFEVYDRGRYFTMTGQGSGVINERQEQLDVVVSTLLPPKPPPRRQVSSNGHKSVPTSDEVLRERMFRSKNGSKLRGLYCTTPVEGEDWSSRDLSLANALAWWTDHDLERMDRMFRASARMRDKWDEPRGDSTWGRNTLLEADRKTVGGYHPPAAANGNGNGTPVGKVDLTWIANRWGLDDDIESGYTRGDVASGRAILYLKLATGRELRFPRLGDLFEPANHTRIVSTVARSRFVPVTKAEATEITQTLIREFGGEDKDPRQEVGFWVMEFRAREVVIPVEDSRPDWPACAEYQHAEAAWQLDRHPRVVFRCLEEVWLPAGSLRSVNEPQMSPAEFSTRMEEAGWREVDFDCREPASREERSTGAPGRLHRNFYVGLD